MRRLSKSDEIFSFVGVALLIPGITYISVIFGAQSPAYYVVLLVSISLCLTRFLRIISKDQGLVILILCFLPIFVFYFQALYLGSGGGEYFWSDLLRSSSLSAAVVLICVAASLTNLPTLMGLIALSHFPLLAWGLLNYAELRAAAYFENTRFGEALHTAVWAEVAIGSLIAAILSRNLTIVFSCLFMSSVLIVATQMRGAGLAVFALILSFTFHHLMKQRGFYSIIVALSALVAIWSQWDSLYPILRGALLLDDPYRGIDSGFSGRFDNWSAGWEIFVSNLVLGVGPSDPVASYTHNGFIKVAAEYGFFGLLAFILFLGRGVIRCIRRSESELFAISISLIVFLLGAPRYVNLQIMPIVALISVASTFELRLLARANAGIATREGS